MRSRDRPVGIATGYSRWTAPSSIPVIYRFRSSAQRPKGSEANTAVYAMYTGGKAVGV
jgi:hypothetical protein